MKKLLSFFILISIIFLSSVHAQTSNLPSPEQIQNDPVVQNVDKLQEIAEQKKWEFLADKWKETLLKNKAIAAMDRAFTNSNFLFVVLFARNYEFSLEMFFTVLIWFALALSALSYWQYFFQNKTYSYLAAYASAIALAWLQIINGIIVGVNYALSLRTEWWWPSLSTLVFITLLIVFWQFNRRIAAQMKKKKKDAKQQNLEHRVEVQEAFRKGINK